MMFYSMLKTTPIYLGSYPVVNKIKTKVKTNPYQQNHPELEHLYFIDRTTNTRLSPNGEPIHMENDLLTGKLLIMVRTTDADCKNDNENNRQNRSTQLQQGNESNNKVSNYLRPGKKRFEIQLQMKFKKQPNPQHQIYLCCGYDKSVKLGKVQQASLQAALQFCKMRLPSFRYSLFGVGKENVCDADQKLGKYEHPYFAFPIETSMDRISITKHGMDPPLLGTDVHEDPENIVLRRNGGTIQFNTKDTYTLCLWNNNVDFVSWKAMNLPAVPKFSLTHVNDGQPMIVKLYLLKNDDKDGKHYQSDMETLLEVEVSHQDVTSIGVGAREWMKTRIHDDDEKRTRNTVLVGMKHEGYDDRSIYGLVESIFT